MTEGGRRKAEDPPSLRLWRAGRGQRAEGGGPAVAEAMARRRKTEDRGQRAEDREQIEKSWSAVLICCLMSVFMVAFMFLVPFLSLLYSCIDFSK